MGVQLFAGKFYKCVYSDYTRLLEKDKVENKTECLSKGYLWYNSKFNFDNIINGYLGILISFINITLQELYISLFETYILYLSYFSSCNI
jgi:hypothetical protein